MSHVEFDRLWALAQGTLGEAEANEVRTHLAACPDCAAALANIQLASPMMKAPPVPDLGADRWRAIDEKVFEAAAREMHRPSLLRTLRAWWDAPLFKPVFAAAVLAAVILVVALAGRPGPGPVEPIAVVPDERANEASVVTTFASSAGGVELKADGKIARGATIATRPQGEAWLKLPDGSKLGVLSATTARLDDLAPKSVRVSLDRGALAVAAAHEPERLLEVTAGRLTVRVVGTRFMVLRDEETSGVVVEEGMVEANVDGKVKMVPAGSSLTVTNQGVEVGAVEDTDRREVHEIVPARPLAQPKPRPLPVPVPVASSDAAVVAVVQPSVPAEPAGEDAGVDDDWAAIPPQPDAGAQAIPVEPAVVQPVQPPDAVAGAPDAGGTRSWLQRQLDNVSRAHCRRVFDKVDEMTLKWPDAGVVMTKRRQAQLEGALKERERCIQKWGYPAPK